MSNTTEGKVSQVKTAPSDSVDQKQHPALRLIQDCPKLFVRQGTVVETWRTHRGRKLGPYYRLAYRQDGRQHSLYLGRSTQLADQVRRALAQLQKLLKESRLCTQLQAQAITALRRHRAETQPLLKAHGLYTRGLEIRGVRKFHLPRIPRPAQKPPRPPTLYTQAQKWSRFMSGRRDRPSNEPP